MFPFPALKVTGSILPGTTVNCRRLISDACRQGAVEQAEVCEGRKRVNYPPRAAIIADRLTFVAAVRGIASTNSTVLGAL
jgi:hypothetical protein